MEVVTQYEIKRYTKFVDEVEEIKDNVLKECLLTLYINNKKYVQLECISENLQELVIGHLFSEGVITSISQIKSIVIDDEKGVVNIESCSTNFSGEGYKSNMRKLSPHTIDKQTIFDISNDLLTNSKIFELTGNVHSVALCKNGEILYFCEDIGRYNALDKAVGFGIRNNIDFGKTMLFTTGRMPSGIVKKVISAGIPVLVSRSAPTDISIELAKKYNLSLIGFARGKSFNIYTN